MNRGMVVLTLLCFGLVGGAVFAYWYVGPGLLSLAFSDVGDDPYYLIDLSRFDDSEMFAARYQSPMTGLVASEGALVMASRALDIVTDGSVSDEWSSMSVQQYEDSGDAVQLLTSSPYRSIAAHAPGVERLVLGTSDAPGEGSAAALPGVWVVWLLHPHADRFDDGLAPLIKLAARVGGRVVWTADVAALIGKAPWQQMVVLGFADSGRAREWLYAPETRLERSLLVERFRRHALLMYRR